MGPHLGSRFCGCRWIETDEEGNLKEGIKKKNP